jgi:lysophospholipase L1-like esterase
MTALARWTSLMLGVLLTTATLGAPASGAPQATQQKRPAVVGIGDSTVAGEGAGSYLPASNRRGDFCHRSYAAAIGQVTLPGVQDLARVNLACAGASTSDVRLGGTRRYGEAPQAEQLRAIARRYDVRLIELTVGANDVGYSSLAHDCILAYLRLAARCATAWTPRIRSRLAATAPKITRDIVDIKSVMRDAGYRDSDYSFVLQSYPAPVTGNMRYGTALRGLFGCPLRSDDGEWARNWVAPEFTAAFARIAAAQHVRLLDLAPALRGREACSVGITRAQEWSRSVSVDLAAIRHGIGPNLIQTSAHPNALGHAQIARCLSAFAATQQQTAKCARQRDGNLAPVATSLSALSVFPRQLA